MRLFSPPRLSRPRFFLGIQTRRLSSLNRAELIEEQTLPRYSTKSYYPVRAGEILNDRYRAISKLGFGAYSTVWLAKDQASGNYVSLKIGIQDDSSNSPIQNEIKTLRHLEKSPREHPGSRYARLAKDIFEVEGRAGRHTCIVSTPQGCSLWTLQNLFPEGKVPVEVVSYVVQRLLGCVNWLFCDCDVIHTEITAQNVLLSMNDEYSFQSIEEDEARDPSVPIEDGDYPVYPSRGNPTSMLQLSLDPVLTDFGSSRSALQVNKNWWMPDTHRAPEILLGVPWDAQVDVWSIGIMALELLSGKNVFTPIDTAANQYVLPLALSQYIGLMGLPPAWMIAQSENEVVKSFFDEQGNWIAEPAIAKTSVEDFVISIKPGEQRDRFLDFIKRILVWDPAERGQSAELFSHEWLIRS